MNDSRIETALTDLLVDPTVRDLARALAALAKVEDDPKAVVALLWATQVVMHGHLIQVHRLDADAAKVNQATYAGLLANVAGAIKDADVARLSELLEVPLIPGPRRAQ